MDADELTEAEACPHCGGRLEPEAESCVLCGQALAEAGEEEMEEAYEDLVLVFRGQPTEVLSLQAAIEARGLPAFVPDATTKVVDPFVTGGGNALLYELMTRESAVDDVRRTIDEIRGRPPEPEPESADRGGPAGDETSPGVDRLEHLARATRFAWILFPPLVLYFGGQYLLLSSQLGRRSERHASTLVALGLGLLLSLGGLGLGTWFWILRQVW